jgi:hypothetical protein
MTATARVFVSSVARMRGIIGVSRTGKAIAVFIVRAVHFGVGDQNCQGCARGFSLVNTAHDPKFVLFNARGRDASLRTAARKGFRNFFFGDGNSGSNAVKDSTDHFAVTFPKEGDGDAVAIRVFHKNLCL